MGCDLCGGSFRPQGWIALGGPELALSCAVHFGRPSCWL